MRRYDLLRDILFVRKCVMCREILDSEQREEAFCDNCALPWQIEMTVTCRACLQSAVECTCMPDLLKRSGALTLRKLTFYSKDTPLKPQNKLLYFIKNKRNSRVSRYIARELMEALQFEADVLGVGEYAKDMFIVNVPRGRRAVARYGHDQSRLICEELSTLTDIPYIPVLLRTRKRVNEQKKLTSAERMKNARGMFEADADLIEATRGRCAVLFDDVVTTGASLAASVYILKSIGVDKVICFSIASTMPKPQKEKKYTE